MIGNLMSKSSNPDFKPWKAPHLLTHQFQLLAKLINALNTNVPAETTSEPWNDDLLIFDAFSHQMMPAWLALAKSYYPFYENSAVEIQSFNQESQLIHQLEERLNMKAQDYKSLQELIQKVFLSKYPAVNSEYERLTAFMLNSIAKLVAVALSTPQLVNDAHKRDKRQFEEAGPAMATCIGPIETILTQWMKQDKLDKNFVLAAYALLLHVKAIKSHFEQMILTEAVETLSNENQQLRLQLDEKHELNESDKNPKSNERPESQPSPKRDDATLDESPKAKQFIKSFIGNLSGLSNYRHHSVGCFFHIKAKNFEHKEKLIARLKQLENIEKLSYKDLVPVLNGYYHQLQESQSKRYLVNLKDFLGLSAEQNINATMVSTALKN
jgi:hypothetical protein